MIFVNTTKIASDGDDLLVFTMNATDGSTAKLPAFQINAQCWNKCSRLPAARCASARKQWIAT